MSNARVSMAPRDIKNNERLRELMTRHRLSRLEVATLLHKAITKGRGTQLQAPAVNKWLAAPDDGANFRSMSDADMELLELKIAMRKNEAQQAKRGKRKE